MSRCTNKTPRLVQWTRNVDTRTGTADNPTAIKLCNVGTLGAVPSAGSPTSHHSAPTGRMHVTTQLLNSPRATRLDPLSAATTIQALVCCATRKHSNPCDYVMENNTFYFHLLNFNFVNQLFQFFRGILIFLSLRINNSNNIVSNIYFEISGSEFTVSTIAFD